MEKIITTYSEYDLELHKDILGRHFDKDGNEFYYQPERSEQENEEMFHELMNKLSNRDSRLY